jgi:hypothetical protein
VGQRGWTPQRYERFPADTWHSILLPDQGAPLPLGRVAAET